MKVVVVVAAAATAEVRVNRDAVSGVFESSDEFQYKGASRSDADEAGEKSNGAVRVSRQLCSHDHSVIRTLEDARGLTHKRDAEK